MKEKSVTVVFRVDASVQIGTGHVMRCLRLADGLRERGAHCHFICREHDGNVIWLIKEKGYNTHALPKEPQALISFHRVLQHAEWLGVGQEYDAFLCSKIIESISPDWVVVDHYALDSLWEERISKVSNIVVIDDLADRQHRCEILIDQNWYGGITNRRYQNLVNNQARLLLGPRYALLGPEYRKKRENLKIRDGNINNILVFMGGADPENRTDLVLRAIKNIEVIKGKKILVVVGVSCPHYQYLYNLYGNEENWIIKRGVDSLVDLMADADLMIGSGGTTTWERMCLGLPSIIMSIAENQVEVCTALSNDRYIEYVGDAKNVNHKDIEMSLLKLVKNKNLMIEQTKKIYGIVDGLGVGRVCEEMLRGSYGIN